MATFERDSEELRRLLETHSVEGYPVEVPIFGAAVIESQSTPSPQFISFKVRPERPQPFDELAEHLRYSDEQMNLLEWEERYVRGSTRTLNFLPEEIMEKLEAGGTASQKDFIFSDLLRKGCLNLEQQVTCFSFEYDRVTIPPKKLKRGMLVDYVESRGEGYGTTRGWAGRIAGFADKRDVVLLEVFSPTPMMRTPDGMVPEKIVKGFYSSKVGFLGKGLTEAFEDQDKALPPGKWSDDNREYTLEDAMEIAEIEEFCKQHYPETPYCVFQAMALYIIPIRVGAGTFHPLPETVVDPGFVVDYESA